MDNDIPKRDAYIWIFVAATITLVQGMILPVEFYPRGAPSEFIPFLVWAISPYIGMAAMLGLVSRKASTNVAVMYVIVLSGLGTLAHVLTILLGYPYENSMLVVLYLIFPALLWVGMVVSGIAILIAM